MLYRTRFFVLEIFAHTSVAWPRLCLCIQRDVLMNQNAVFSQIGKFTVQPLRLVHTNINLSQKGNVYFIPFHIYKELLREYVVYFISGVFG